MNIFALSSNPVEAAKQMVDKHVVKMPTESCQMLHTNTLYFVFVSAHGREPSLRELKAFHAESHYQHLMKPAMLNHPSTIWARETEANYMWLYHHALALCEEYTYRYGKEHGSQKRILDSVTFEAEPADKTPLRIAMADEYRLDHEEYFVKNPSLSEWDFVIDSYRNYYIKAKYKFANWKGREVPSWYDFSYGEKKEKALADKLRAIVLAFVNKTNSDN